MLNCTHSNHVQYHKIMVITHAAFRTLISHSLAAGYDLQDCRFPLLCSSGMLRGVCW